MKAPTSSVRRTCVRCEKSLFPPRCASTPAFRCPSCGLGYRCVAGGIAPVRSGLSWADLWRGFLGLMGFVALILLGILLIVALTGLE